MELPEKTMSQAKAKSKIKKPNKLSKWVFFAHKLELSEGESLWGITVSYVRKVRWLFQSGYGRAESERRVTAQ